MRPAGLLIVSEIRDATAWAIKPVLSSSGGNSPITLALGGGSALVGEAYTLDIASDGVKLTAGTYAGMVAATATLVQAVEMAGDYDAVPTTPQNCTTAPVWRLPVMEVSDSPALPYRGLMVDAARAYLPPVSLKALVMLCRMYKLNYLHIHMTDTGAFTFPSTAYPALSAKSSIKYNLTELHDVQTFAAARGVTILAEVDVPGHATAMTHTLPGTFGFKSAPQLGIIDFTNASVILAVQTIFDEISAVFPSEYVHMGGDEVDFGALTNLPEIAAALKRENVAEVADLYRIFIGKMDAYAKSRNKTLHVWEGFKPPQAPAGAKDGPVSSVPVSKDVIVSPFDCNIYPPPQLAADGYKLVNSAWTPLYIAAHGTTGVHHPFPPELVYRWNPGLFGSVTHALEWWQIPPEHASAVIGAQMCVWAMSAQEHLCMLSSRAPAMAERLWSPGAGRTFTDYAARVNRTGALLHRLLVAEGLVQGAHPVPQPPLPGDGPAAMTAAGPPESAGIALADCAAMCAKLGKLCDAYDWHALPATAGPLDEPAAGVACEQCTIWGSQLTEADEQTDARGNRFQWGTGGSPNRMCREIPAVGSPRYCFLRQDLPRCPAPGPGGGNGQPGCLAGCSCV
eukprot:g1202.t1